MVSDVSQAGGIEARLTQAASLPETLAAGFDAFEVIRMTARDWQDRAPGLFAAFMTAADAAVDGREALTIAPSLPQADGARPDTAAASVADQGQAADALAALASGCVTGSPVPLPRRSCLVTGPRAGTARRRPGGSAS